MTLFFILKFLHIMGAAVLMGTGAGIAFFMLMAHRTGDPRLIAGVARIVVIADYAFTATAVVAQPVTGLWLAHEAGYGLGQGWIVLSIILYLVTGAFWLPVVWVQAQLKRIAQQAADWGEPLPTRYHRLFRIWFWFGFPAFASVAGIFWLMITRPQFSLWPL